METFAEYQKTKNSTPPENFIVYIYHLVTRLLQILLQHFRLSIFLIILAQKICKMYVQGRSSARQATVFATLIILFPLLFHLPATQATTYTVGDSSGWNFNVGNWTSGKSFNAGDILIFNYDSSLHNVVVVDVNGYNKCTASSKARTYSSGKDQIKLSRGRNYYICTFPGHCDGGLKMQAYAY